MRSPKTKQYKIGCTHICIPFSDRKNIELVASSKQAMRKQALKETKPINNMQNKKSQQQNCMQNEIQQITFVQVASSSSK